MMRPWPPVVSVLVLGLLVVAAAVDVHAAGSGFQRQTILTEWGTFRCSAIDCAQVPRANLDVYWSAPTLVVTRNHVPLVMRTCHLLSGPTAAWDCRPRQHGPPIELDALWSWVDMSDTDPEADW